jgi:thioesterase domain-containing protein
VSSKAELGRARHRFRRLARAQWNPTPLRVDAVLIRAKDHGWEARIDMRDLGWRELIKGELTTYQVPGSHLAMLQAPIVHQVADILRTHLISRQ